MTHLDQIIAAKIQHVTQRKQYVSLNDLQHTIATLAKPMDFKAALQGKIATQQLAIIAEIKRASPSKGLIREDFDPVDIALQYQQANATCLSVLTDEKFFQGSDAIFQQVRQACPLPMLRKDFIIDPYQIFESRALGADCILLIVAALNQQQLHDLATLANELQLSVLIEAHNADELAQALAVKHAIIGINNRNLHTFTTSLHTTIELVKHIPSDRLVISESGIHHADDMTLLLKHHVHGFLIGESLMRAAKPGEQLTQFTSAAQFPTT